MTAFRDSLPDDATRDRFDTAMGNFGQAFDTARRKRNEIYQSGGARAVAEAAWVPGGPSIEELAEGYEALAERARQSRTAA
jgi:hypothetical protein